MHSANAHEKHVHHETAVFTIVSNNYRAFAATLMKSISDHHPDWDRYVLLVDKAALSSHRDDLYRTVLVETLPLPESKKFLFRYSILELNTAVKPWMLEHLLALGYKRVIYLDPDILVVSPLLEVESALKDNATGVLTPHLLSPIVEDGKHPGELEIILSGTYNLGFIAVTSSPTAARFVAWWKKKLERHAGVDLAVGLFTDQKWIDLVPGMFPGFHILLDPGYNVAYWNLAQREVAYRDSRWIVNGRPLRFFHFSGFDPEKPIGFSKYQNRYTLETVGAVKPLVLSYAAEVLDNGHLSAKSSTYSYGLFANGATIPDFIRWKYRRDAEIERAAGPDPFSAFALWELLGEDGLSPAIMAIWESRSDLQKAFPDPSFGDREKLIQWFLTCAPVEYGIAAAFFEPFKQKAGPWGRMLTRLHTVIAGRPPAPKREAEYHTVKSTGEFVRVILRRACASLSRLKQSRPRIPN
jgi:hypothetical protein